MLNIKQYIRKIILKVQKVSVNINASLRIILIFQKRNDSIQLSTLKLSKREYIIMKSIS